jgi:UDP-glucose 4-epimerase
VTLPAAAAAYPAYAGKRVLITGANGYIGTVILGLLKDADCGVRGLVPPELVSLEASLQAIGPSSLEIAGADIRTVEDYIPFVEGFDLVIHLAAQTSHYEANERPREDFALNVAPVLRLLEACRTQKRPPRVVFASSATVVGLPQALPVTEDAFCRPITMYDIHKLCAEEYLRFFAREHGVPSCSLRLANVYGESPTATKTSRGVVNQMARRALAGEDLTVFGSGAWLRDYVHLSDVAEAFLAAGSLPESELGGRSFNVCTGTGTAFRDVLAMLRDAAEKMSGRRSNIVHVDKVLSPIDERSYVGSHDALTRACGWTPQIDLATGLGRLLDATARGG